jgi:hypothetical protein
LVIEEFVFRLLHKIVENVKQLVLNHY